MGAVPTCSCKEECKKGGCDVNQECSGMHPLAFRRQTEEMDVTSLSKDELLVRLKQLAGAEETQHHVAYKSVLERVLNLMTGALASVPGSAALVLVAPEREIACLEPEYDDDGLLSGELDGVTVHDPRFEQSLSQVSWCFSGEVDSRGRPVDSVFAVDHSTGQIVAASAYFPNPSPSVYARFSGGEYMSAVDIAASLDRGVVFTRSKQGVVSVYPASEAQWGRCFKVSVPKKDVDRGENVELAVMLDNLGHGHLQKGNPQAAKQLHERALRIQEAHYGPHHVQVGVTLDNLGICHIQLGNPSVAKGFLERSLKINEKHFGPNHVQVAWTLDNLGSCFRDLGDMRQAHASHERALHIYQNEYGSDHTRLCPTFNNIGHVHRGVGNPALAKNFYQHALVICEKEVEPDPAAVAVCYNNYGNAVREMGDVQEAKTHYEHALSIAEQKFGSNHAEVGRTLNNLGLAHQELGRPQEAHPVFKRALEIFDLQFGARNACAAMVRVNLAMCLATLGKYKQSKEHLLAAEASADASAGASANLELEFRASTIRFAIGETASPTPQERWHKAESQLQDLLGVQGLDAVCARCKEGLLRIWKHSGRPDVSQWIQARGTARI